MYSKKINQLATNLNPQSTDLLPIGDAETGQLKTTTFNQISGVTGDGVISGGIVTWTGTGLIFNISACTYYLNGIRYTSPFSTKTLAAADPTNPRIDVFAVNTSSQVEVIQGTPNANPVEPEGDTATTLGLTNVTIAAGATTPSNVTRDLIYDENVETWTKTFTQSQATVDYANTLFPNTGSKSILVTMGSGFINLNFSKAVALDISNYKSLSFAIRLTNALTSNTILGVRFYNGSNTVSNLFQIGTSNNVGFNRNLAGSYQIITIPFNNTNLRFTSNAFTTIRISTQNAPATYRLDTIQLNGGINNPGGGTTTPSNSFGFVNGSTGTASSTTATDTLNVVGSGLITTSATGKTLTIASNQIATSSILGRVTAGTGNIETLTGTQATTLLDVFTSSLKGLAPASGGGTTNFLRADGTWAAAGGGTTIYTGDDTLTSNRTITSGGFSLTFTGSNSATSGISRGLNLTHTLVATSSSDYLIGLDINNTFTNGAFASVLNVGIRAKGSYLQVPNTQGLQIGFHSGNTPTTQSNIAITNSGTGGTGTYQTFPIMTGQRNIFILGTTSAQSIGSPTISGSDNIIIGKLGISNPHSGTYNTLINTGSVALTSGAGNTAIGPFALKGITTGSNNIHITSNGGAGNGNFPSALANTIYIGDPVKTNNFLTAAGDVVICTPYGVGNVFWFGGKSDSGDVVFNIPTRAGSTNAAGHTRTTRAGIATGTGEAGKIVFQHSTPVASGTTLQSAFTDTLSLERLKIYTPSTVSVIIGGTTANASALLQVDSTAKGFLPPRMTTTQKNAIGTPAAGLIVFDTTLNKLCVYTTAWETITSV